MNRDAVALVVSQPPDRFVALNLPATSEARTLWRLAEYRMTYQIITTRKASEANEVGKAVDSDEGGAIPPAADQLLYRLVLYRLEPEDPVLTWRRRSAVIPQPQTTCNIVHSDLTTLKAEDLTPVVPLAKRDHLLHIFRPSAAEFATPRLSPVDQD